MRYPATFIVVLMVMVQAGLAGSERPNILFVMSDDHTTQAIGAYGSRLAKLNPTPTIDTLAKEGVVMENAFCLMGAVWCGVPKIGKTGVAQVELS